VKDAAALLVRQGYVLRTPSAGSLTDGQSTQISVYLERGRRYHVLGRCDIDCDDLDLELTDSAGAEIDSDTAVDDRPFVAVTPIFSGTYRLRVIMAECSRNPCVYGVGILER
jgi:hypothetical protein